MDSNILSEKLCKKCNLIKQLTEFHKCSRNKTGVQSKCKMCMNAYYKQNSEKLIQRTRQWDKENKERRKEWQKEWIKKNPNKRAMIISRYYQKNKEKAAAASKKWKKNNSWKISYYASKRKAILLQATPPWADLAQIEIEYKLAAWCTAVMGEPYHVDHIVPLINKKVCGLHVHQNLRVIRGIENISKSNKFNIE